MKGYETRLISRLLTLIMLLALIPVWRTLITTITFYPVYWTLLPFYEFARAGTTLTLTPYVIEYTSACAATLAYVLLAILILTTKDIPLKKGVFMFLTGSALILFANIIRIHILLNILLTQGTNHFEALHILFWKVLSTLYVFLVWILLTRLYSVRTIPVYSDFTELLHKTRLLKN